MFTVSRKLPGWVNGLSLAVLNTGPMVLWLPAAVLLPQGLSALWLLGGVVGIQAIFFAPLWARLPVQTDNQFLLLRFSGVGARILHRFRAVYVGGLVAALLLAGHHLSLRHLLAVLLPASGSQTLWGALLLVGAVAISGNHLRRKLQADAVLALLLLISLAWTATELVQVVGGWLHLRHQLITQHSDWLSLIPRLPQGDSWGTWLVYVGVAWWSTRVLDGAGGESQRYRSNPSARTALWSALLPIPLGVLTTVLVCLCISAGLVLLTTAGQAATPEAFAMLLAKQLSLPCRLLLGCTLLLAYLNVVLNLLNWAGGLLIHDLWYRGQVNAQPTVREAVMAMALLWGLSLLLALAHDGLREWLWFLMGISAGVGPVFILRWFWWRINAWSQLSAMLGALGLNLAWNLWMPDEWTQAAASLLAMDAFSFQLLALTLAVTVLWLPVTFLTPPDPPAHQQTFARYLRSEKRTSTTWHKLGLVVALNIGLVAIYLVLYGLMY